VDAPRVPAPDDCERYRFFARGRGDIGDLVEIRLAHGRQLDEIERDGQPGSGDFALWVRCVGSEGTPDAATLALIGDFMPLGFADAVGAGVAGNSLDNTIRLGRLVPTDWVLMTTHVEQIIGGFGHGRAELWSEDGTLMGQVSQTAIMRDHSTIRARGDGV
jgi:acyl-CoA thioesterase